MPVAPAFATLALVALATLLPGIANAALPKSGGLLFVYEVRARDSRLGVARITVGPKQTLGKRQVRAVTIVGNSEDLVGILYAGSSNATTWVDSGWLPTEAHWKSTLGQKASETEAVYGPHRVQATFARPGKPVYKVDQATDRAPQDLVSFMPWLMQQKVKPGFRVTIPVYTGMDVCDIEATARPVESVSVPLGKRLAIPVDIVFKRCRVSRSFTAWLDVGDFTPHRMTVPHPVLGNIDVQLVSVQPFAAAPVYPVGPRKEK